VSYVRQLSAVWAGRHACGNGAGRAACIQEIEREFTDTLEKISRIKGFSVKELLAVTHQLTNNVRNAAVTFVRCAPSYLPNLSGLCARFVPVWSNLSPSS
jgi:hypothetical protein